MLRCHSDDAKHYKVVRNNPGNLQKLLKFVASCRKITVFEEQMELGPKSSTYPLKKVQNELIHTCHEMILKQLTSEIKEAKFFSVLVDEATVTSNVEQMPIVLCFMNTSTILKLFLFFLLATRECLVKQFLRKVLKV